MVWHRFKAQLHKLLGVCLCGFLVGCIMFVWLYKNSFGIYGSKLTFALNQQWESSQRTYVQRQWWYFHGGYWILGFAGITKIGIAVANSGAFGAGVLLGAYTLFVILEMGWPQLFGTFLVTLPQGLILLPLLFCLLTMVHTMSTEFVISPTNKKNKYVKYLVFLLLGYLLLWLATILYIYVNPDFVSFLEKHKNIL